MKIDPIIQFQAHMLDESFKDELYEKDDSSKKESKEEKIDLDKLCKMMKVMRPGAVMQFVAKVLGSDSTKFIAKNSLKLASKAIKNGWVKTKDIAGSIKDFSKKNKEDKSGIDYSKLKLDPSTMSFKCLFDGETGKKLNVFINEFESEIKDEGKEIEKADKQLHADVKKAGVDMNEQEIDDNGLAVASVIDNKKNKGKNGKELKKKIESAIKKDKQVKEIQKISEELKKASSKVKVDKKYEKMSDEELTKLDDKINKKIRNRSEASKKNDAFRSKIKNAVQKGVTEDFKKSVKTAYVSTDKLKKSIASNMKPGLAVEQIEEPRAVCISVQCGKKDFGNVLKEADGSAKIIDVTNGSKDKSIQKVIDYIKKVLQDKIGKDKLGKKIYAYLKNASGNCLLYVFAGVKQDKLDESLLNEETLTDDSPIEDIMAHVKVDGDKISGFSGGMVLSSLLKKLNVGDNKEFLKSISPDDQSIGQTQKAVELLLKRFIINNENDGADKAIKELFRSIGDDEYKKLMYSELVTKMIPEVKDKFAEKGITTIGNLQGLFGNKEIDDWVDSIASQPTLKDAAKELKDTVKDATAKATDAAEKIEKMMSKVEIDGGKLKYFNSPEIYHQTCKSLSLTDDDMASIFSRTSSSNSINMAKNKLMQNIQAFIVNYDKDPDKAAKFAMIGLKNDQKDALAEILCKIKPEAAEKFKDLGIDIDGKIGHVAAKAADAATDIVSTTADTASDAMNSIPSFNYHDINTELRELNNVFSDGKIDADEMQKIAQFGDKLNSFSKWAAEHQNINNPFVQAKIAEIKALSEDYHYMLEDNKNVLDSAAAAASDARTGATEATRAASKNIANDEEVKKAAGGWKEKLGLNKAFTALGWARLAAKSTAIILNNGKSVVDALGAAAMKFKEDKGVIAQMNFLLSNADDSDTKFSDTKFSVRFNINDMKWHATCLDDRKMKFPEDEVIKKALDSEEGKKFKQVCLKKWSPIFDPKDKTHNILTYIMTNFDKIGLKDDSAEAKKVSETIEKMQNDFKTIEKEFK